MSGKTQGRQSMPHTTDFEFDVFLSHSSQDKPLVHDLAERLKADGLRVWFDQWQIRPGDSIPHKIEEGLERGRVACLGKLPEFLDLCARMSGVGRGQVRVHGLSG